MRSSPRAVPFGHAFPNPPPRALGWRRAQLRSLFAIRAPKRTLDSPGAEAKLAEKKWGGEDWQGRSAAPRPPSREGKKAITAWYDPGVLKQLKQIATDENTNLQAPP